MLEKASVLWRRQSVKAEPVLVEQNRRRVHINRGAYYSHLFLETRPPVCIPVQGRRRVYNKVTDFWACC
jgi:hypothetical protein